MKKPKFSSEKAHKTVEISSKIEGHKVPSRETNKPTRTKVKVKN